MLGIIIPTYDSLETLKALIESIYTHTIGKFTVYVIEDGQREETVSYLKSITHKNFRVLYHGENKGIAKSWNDGLRQALSDNCDFFAILNDDVEVCENWWRIARQSLQTVDMVCLDAPCPIPLTGWFFIISTTVLMEVGFFDEQFAPYTSEDADYFFRFEQRGLKYARIPLAITHHGSATINKIKTADPLKFKQVWNDNWNRLRKKYPNKKMQDNFI